MLKKLVTGLLLAGVACGAFAQAPPRPMRPAPSAKTTVKPATKRVKGYTYKTKSGKVVRVKAHERKSAMKPGAVHVKGYTYKTKSGKTVHVKAHERKAPSKTAAPKKM